MGATDQAGASRAGTSWLPRLPRTRRKSWEPYADWILAQLGRRPDIYLRELQAAAQEELDWQVSDVTLSRACRALRRTRKKTLIAAEQDRPDVAEARRQWGATQLAMDPDRVVFFDETWAKTNMTRCYGSSPRGARLQAKTPYARWETTTRDAFDRLRGAVVRRGRDQRPALRGVGGA